MSTTTSSMSEYSSSVLRHLAPSRILILPLGAVEQHGPHLPVDTDTRITEAIVDELVRRHGADVLVAPTFSFGSSGEHLGFTGTLSLPNTMVTEAVIEICRSASEFKGIFIVTAHGGNALALAAAVTTLRSESRRVDLWFPTRSVFQDSVTRLEIGPEARGAHEPDLHAGRTETSIMLALAPDTVRTDAYEPGYGGTDRESMRILMTRGTKALSPNGVLGNPEGANYEEGCILLAAMADDINRHFRESVAW